MAEVTGKKTFHVIADVILALILIAVLCVAYFAAPPFNRGFFCNDESIQKPYVSKQTVPSAVLLAVGLILALVVIHASEVMNYLRFSRKFAFQIDETKLTLLHCINVKSWIYRMYSRIWYFIIGMVITVFFTELGKKMVGRLRPHFLAVCKPNYAMFNCSDGFITGDYCTGVAKHIIEARKSFPSGHSSFSAYIAVFLCLYLQYATRSKEIKLLAPVVQVGLIAASLFTSLGRISDYFHHWSDVFAGLILGTLVAYYMIFVLMDLRTEEEKLNVERSSETEHLAEDIERRRIASWPLG